MKYKPKKRLPQTAPRHCPWKKSYRINNWREYNAALVKRGSFTVWIDEAAIIGWLTREHHGGRGASCTYSDAAITAALLVKSVYHLPLRATQGLLGALLSMMGLALPVPHYSTLSRRQACLNVKLPRRHNRQGLHLVVDSTGCKVYGEGEWKIRLYGYSYRRTWRKLHLGVDESTGEILAVTLTTNNICDGEVLSEMLNQVEEPIYQLTGDGSYDQSQCYKALQEYQAAQGQPLRVVIPPQRGAALWKQAGEPKSPQRDANLKRMGEIGRRRWKRETGYYRQSKVENAMYRYKSVLGGKLQARDFERQKREALIGCIVLNRMAALGMPDSYVAN